LSVESPVFILIGIGLIAVAISYILTRLYSKRRLAGSAISQSNPQLYPLAVRKILISKLVVTCYFSFQNRALLQNILLRQVESFTVFSPPTFLRKIASSQYTREDIDSEFTQGMLSFEFDKRSFTLQKNCFTLVK
jgi:hypothetical protein